MLPWKTAPSSFFRSSTTEENFVSCSPEPFIAAVNRCRSEGYSPFFAAVGGDFSTGFSKSSAAFAKLPRRGRGRPCQKSAPLPEAPSQHRGRRTATCSFLTATGGNFPQFPRRRVARDGAAQPPTGCRQFSETSNRRRGFSLGSPRFFPGEGETALFYVERKSFFEWSPPVFTPSGKIL